MADIVSSGTGAITPLSGRTDISAASYLRMGFAYDYALGGIPLLSKIDDEHPFTRELAPIRKDQFDNQQIPGEQSLTGWWLRSQSSFVGGEGTLFQDPSNENQYAIRYFSGYGVDPWTNGKLRLLKRTFAGPANVAANIFVRGYVNAGDFYWQAGGTTLTSVTTAGVGTNVVHGAAGTLRGLTSSGANYYVMGTNGIWTGTGTGAGAQVCADIAGVSNRGTLEVVKHRLMAAFNNEIYEIPLNTLGAAVPATLRYTHLNPSFIWNSFADGPNGIFAAGNDEMTGSILKFTVDNNGAIPTLTGGAVNATMPAGEYINKIRSYMGNFIGICTSRGFRVGTFDEQGNITYGPLLFEISGGVKDCTGFDRFFWATATNSVNGKTGLYRVDLGQIVQDQGSNPTVRYAYASDISSLTTGTGTGVTTLGNNNQRVFAVSGVGTFIEHATEYEATGVMQTGRIRFNTLENKLYKFASIRTPDPIPGGTLNVASVDKTGATTSLITYSTAVAPGGNDVSVSSPLGPQEYISLKFTLTRDATPTISPELNGWQLKAVPGVIRQRMITISFLMHDYEMDRTGNRTGHIGRTQDRLRSIEQIAQTGEAIQFQDLNYNLADLIFIEEMQFRQTSSPDKGGLKAANYGGILTVRMRTVNDIVNIQ